MSFIILTSAEDGKRLDVRAEHVQAIVVLDQMTTHVFLQGGAELLVRETRAQVRHLVDLAELHGANVMHGKLPSLRSG